MDIPAWEIDRLVWLEGMGRLQARRHLTLLRSSQRPTGPRKRLPPGTTLVHSASEPGKWLVSCPAGAPDPAGPPVDHPAA